MRAFAIAAILTVAARASADPDVVRVVVRDGGAALAVSRLRGQLADLEVDVRMAPGALEPTLDAQLATAAHLAEAEGARAVVWFVPHGRGIAVAIATPADHRLFVREIPAADASAVAEAAAIAARGAVRAILLGGTIGVEVPTAPAMQQPDDDRVPLAPHVASRERTGLEAALGWQVALDNGADRGAHAIAQRTSLARGAWAGSLALTLGAPMHHAGQSGVTLELSRTGAALGIERRLGAFAIGISAGALLYHRTTLAAPDGLAPTPDASTVAFAFGPEVTWRWRIGHVGVVATAGLDVVAGAPDPVIVDNGAIVPVGHVRALQPRLSLSVFAGLP